MTRRDNNQQGFTLIELLFAMAFVGFIIVFAITTVIQVMGTYNKGLAVKQINQAGRTTLEDISRYIRTSKPGTITVISANRACLGGISYVWNLWNTPASSANKYDDNSLITLARVNDSAKAMCTPLSGGGYPNVPKDQAINILGRNVWVMSLTIDSVAGGTLVDVAVNLAVANEPALVGGQCTQGGTEGQFCATSNFRTTVMVGEGQ